MTDRILGRYDAAAVRQLFEEAGVIRAVERKGFGPFEVAIDAVGRALPHALLFGYKRGNRCLLLDACLGEATVRPEFFQRRATAIAHPIELVVVHWIREQDPTVGFAAERPPLPLQRHPGLRVLRHAFRVAARMAQELDKDGVASVPKFFHDAVIFMRSRLFLFLDGHEQGRFEALLRDLNHLPLGDASLVIACGGVHDENGSVLHWTPGYQVFPLRVPLTDYFHSTEYAARVASSLDRGTFTVDVDAVARAHALFQDVMRRLGRRNEQIDAVVVDEPTGSG